MKFQSDHDVAPIRLGSRALWLHSVFQMKFILNGRSFDDTGVLLSTMTNALEVIANELAMSTENPEVKIPPKLNGGFELPWKVISNAVSLFDFMIAEVDRDEGLIKGDRLCACASRD